MKEFVQSLWRLYNIAHAIDEQTIYNLLQAGKITEDEKDYIFNITKTLTLPE